MDHHNLNEKLEMDLSQYPARLEIDYPEKLDRLSTLLRLFYLIPAFLLLTLLSGIVLGAASSATSFQLGAGVLFLAPMFMLLIRQKYPYWWFNWNLEFTRFNTRVMSYAALLSDEYPSSDEAQAVHLDLDYPDAKKLNRWLPLVKWFLAIPHILCLIFLGLAAFFCIICAWFAILITGKYPRVLFDFVVGVMRWALRVNAYALLLITDKYPPFSLKR